MNIPSDCPDYGIGDHDCVEHGDTWPPDCAHGIPGETGRLVCCRPINARPTLCCAIRHEGARGFIRDALSDILGLPGR